MQSKDELKLFLETAVSDLTTEAEWKAEELRLANEELELKSNMDALKKAMEDKIFLTLKKRESELNKTYDEEENIINAKIKKIRLQKDKAKNQGIKERIKEETKEEYDKIKDIKKQLKDMLRRESIPFFCKSPLYHALYLPKSLSDFLILLCTFMLCFVGVPIGSYWLLPNQRMLYLIVIYVICILLFGILYTVTGNLTRGRYLESLRSVRILLDEIGQHKRSIRRIISGIRKDKDETGYHLETYDTEIVELEKGLEELYRRREDALKIFESETKVHITDEIRRDMEPMIRQYMTDYTEVTQQKKKAENARKDKTLFISERYEAYIGRDFMDITKLKELIAIVEDTGISNIQEAIEKFKGLNQ